MTYTIHNNLASTLANVLRLFPVSWVAIKKKSFRICSLLRSFHVSSEERRKELHRFIRFVYSFLFCIHCMLIINVYCFDFKQPLNAFILDRVQFESDIIIYKHAVMF